MLKKPIWLLLIVVIASVLAVASYASANATWFKVGDALFKSAKSNQSGTVVINRDNGENKSLTDNKPINMHKYTVNIARDGKSWPLTIQYTIENNQKKLLGVMEDNGGLNKLISKNQDKVLLSEGTGIWVIDSEGNFKKLTSDIVNNTSFLEEGFKDPNITWASNPIFSEDEEFIIYRSNLSNNGIGPKMNLWMMKSDGSDNKLLYEPVNNHLEIIDWLGESELLLNSNNEISVLNTTTGINEAITRNFSPISLSPNKKILMGLKRNENSRDMTKLYSLNLATRQLNELSAHRDGFRYTSYPAWSPDNQKFAYLIENASLDKVKMRVVFLGEDGIERSVKEIESNKEPFVFYGSRGLEWLNNDEILVELANLGEKVKDFQTWTVKVTD